MKYLVILSLLVSCGQALEVEDSTHTVGGDTNHTIEGETKNILILEMPFITQVNELCKDLNIVSDFASIELYKQEVAKCTFDNISVLNIGNLDVDGFGNVIDDICAQPEYINETICQ